MEELACFTLPIKDLEDSNYGYSDIEYLKELGAKIEEHHYDRCNKHFINITLPEGYSIGEVSMIHSFKQRVIYDENNNDRGSFFVKTDDLRIAGISLRCKYGVSLNNFEAGGNKFCKVYFGNNEEELFVSGIVPVASRDYSSLYVQSQISNYKESCEEMANDLYPEWRNPLAYWENTKELTSATTLVRTKED